MEELDSQNPSYQNFLAKQMLANPKAHGLNSTTPALANDAPSTDDSGQKLGNLLDVIDSKRKQPPEDTDAEQDSVAVTGESASEETVLNDVAAAPPAAAPPGPASSPYDWIKNFDATTGHFYYYNYKTGLSQWEMPEGFVETPTPYQQPAPLTDPSAYAATFNQKTGSFSATGTSSYWEQVDRPPDREGRQMSAFFDLNALEKNRAEAKAKKEQLQVSDNQYVVEYIIC